MGIAAPSLLTRQRESTVSWLRNVAILPLTSHSEALRANASFSIKVVRRRDRVR